MKRKQKGFTLIELMIVVAIVGILASIALPAYNDYITRARITEGVAALSDMRVKLEQYFQDNRTYVGACTTQTTPPTSIAHLPGNTEFFQYSCSNLGATTYTVQAQGINAMNGFVYTIDQNNVRTTAALPGGWNGAGNSCWVTKKSGEC
ncbi:MAG: type IV pilin protein [Rhodocyclaceae bacterium]|nr:type IV pilin protein [Rhodocyclaceae bacterium]